LEWGAWLWSDEGATADQFAVSAYLAGGPEDGVMFEVSTLPDVDPEHEGLGILRESFTWDETTMTMTSCDPRDHRGACR
jgi:hypothetical protein